MDGIITEKDYPVQGLWIFKSRIGSLLSLIILVQLLWLSRFDTSKALKNSMYLIIIFATYSYFHLIVTILRRATFHYSIEGQFLTLRQGILSKQQRHIPYGVIQNLFVKQDLFDRVFGLASLTIENASQGGGKGFFGGSKSFQLSEIYKQQGETVGSSGNKVNIPGLKKKDAEVLKMIILQRMKENPIEDSQSGL